MLSGLAVFFKKPVYSMVTVSPTLGIAPFPSLRIVLVTPMIAAVDLKDLVVEGSLLYRSGSLVVEIDRS